MPAKNRRTATLATLIAVVVWCRPSRAATSYWLGCPNGSFSDPACWTTLPTSLASPRTLVFNGGQSPADDVASLEIATLQLNGNSVGTFMTGPAVLGLHAAGASPGLVQLAGTNKIYNGLSLALTSDVADSVEIQVLAGDLQIAAPLLGSSGVRKTGAGTLSLLANNANAGPLRVDDGIVELDAPGFDGAVPSATVFVGDGVGAGSSAVLREKSINNIANGASVVVSPDGWFDLNGLAETIGALYGSGKVSLGGATLQVRTSGTTTFSGAIDGPGGSFQMNGAGVQVLTGPNSYTGPTTVLSGELRVNGSQPASAATVSLGASLRGTGVVGPLVVGGGGVVHPGSGNASGGVLSVAGTATLQGGAILSVKMYGSAAVERLTVQGAAMIGGAQLDVSVGYVPAPGTEFTVLSAGSIVGEFAGKPEGTVLCVNGTRMVVYYSATAVTLSVVSDPPQVTAPAAVVVTQSTCP